MRNREQDDTAGGPPRGRRAKPGDGAAKAAPSALPLPEQVEFAHEAALRLLSVRERSESELRTRLRMKGFSVDAMEAVLERLRRTDLLSDRRFAERYAEGAVGRGLATRRIQGELLRRGVDKETAAQAAAEPPEAEEERARAVAARKAETLGRLDPEARARRLVAFLARRGFPPELCFRLAREFGAAPDDD